MYSGIKGTSEEEKHGIYRNNQTIIRAYINAQRHDFN